MRIMVRPAGLHHDCGNLQTPTAISSHPSYAILCRGCLRYPPEVMCMRKLVMLHKFPKKRGKSDAKRGVLILGGFAHGNSDAKHTETVHTGDWQVPLYLTARQSTCVALQHCPPTRIEIRTGHHLALVARQSQQTALPHPQQRYGMSPPGATPSC